MTTMTPSRAAYSLRLSRALIAAYDKSHRMTLHHDRRRARADLALTEAVSEGVRNHLDVQAASHEKRLIGLEARMKRLIFHVCPWQPPAEWWASIEQFPCPAIQVDGILWTARLAEGCGCRPTWNDADLAWLELSKVVVIDPSDTEEIKE